MPTRAHITIAAAILTAAALGACSDGSTTSAAPRVVTADPSTAAPPAPTTRAPSTTAPPSAAPVSPPDGTPGEGALRMELRHDDREPGATSLELRIVDGSGAAVRDFEVVHEKLLHLIVASHDLGEYHHVHPAMDPHGIWRVDVPLGGGPFRVFADFTARGNDPAVLTADITVAGEARRGTTEPTSSVDVDGYRIDLKGAVTVGDDNVVTVEVTRDGRPADLEPYLGAAGHLVSITADDLGYTHVHPMDHHVDHDVAFLLHPSTSGRHRLFFDFHVDGVPRTAAFTVDVLPRG